jgi:membrane-bound lytic murein transglycosylase A
MASLRLFTILLIGMTLTAPDAQARSRRRSSGSGGGSCGASQARSTVYNLPQEDKKETWKGFKTFQSAVKMQGSGRRTNGNIARYKGGDVKADPTCKTTKTSASGQCLLSYFSIAADPRSGWRMGDIIYMRGLADQEITLPSGRKIRHPGFFIVHDTGGAIKGPNRFDFFIGTTSLHGNDNAFKPFNLADKNMCQNKGFEKIARGSAKYNDALAQIYNNQDSDTSRGNQQGPAGPAQSVAGR